MTASQAHILHVFPNFTVGGLEMRACALMNHFGGRFRHSIFSMNGHTAAAECIDDGVDVSFVDIPYRKEQTVRNVLLFGRKLRELSPDLLLSYNWGTIEWAMASSLRRVCPHVHAEDGFKDDEAQGQKPMRVWMRRIFLRHCVNVVLPSTILHCIALRSWWLGRSRAVYIPNGIDVDRFARRAREARDAANRRGTVIAGTVASLSKVKNQMRLLRVIRGMGDCARLEVRIAGTGDQESALRRFVAENGLEGSVRFLGHCDRPEDVFAEMDVFCLTSDSEQMPISVLEAMAAGLPVVATDVGDTKQMVCKMNRPYIVNKNDEAALGEALQTLVNDTDVRARIGAKNRERCRVRFGKETMFTAYEQLYEKAIRHGTRNAARG